MSRPARYFRDRRARLRATDPHYVERERVRRRQGKQRRLAKKRSLKKRYCEECNFIAVHPCQLDLDHIDGNHKNNQPENLKTLCANCHRLKTERAGEWLALPLRPTRA